MEHSAVIVRWLGCGGGLILRDFLPAAAVSEEYKFVCDLSLFDRSVSCDSAVK